jgi:hypothetical protein
LDQKLFFSNDFLPLFDLGLNFLLLTHLPTILDPGQSPSALIGHITGHIFALFLQHSRRNKYIQCIINSSFHIMLVFATQGFAIFSDVFQ